jgi:hypothetical protein
VQGMEYEGKDIRSFANKAGGHSVIIEGMCVAWQTRRKGKERSEQARTANHGILVDEPRHRNPWKQ